MPSNNTCPICNSSNPVPFLNRPGHFISIFLAGENIPDINVEFVFCQECCHIYLSSAYHDSLYTEITNRLYERYALLEQTVRPFPQRDKHYNAAVDFFTRTANPGNSPLSVLDVGSNRGDFLYLLQEALPCITVHGIEPSRLSFYGVPTTNMRFEECTFDTQFDVIISRHVLEHLASPYPFILKAHELLKDDGLLFLEIPNLHYDLPRGIENFIPEHIHHFSQLSLNTFLSRCGFHLTHIDDSRPEGLRMLARKNAASKQTLSSPNPTIKASCAIEMAHIHDYTSRISYCVNSITKAMRDGYRPAFYGFGNVFFLCPCRIKKTHPP